MIAEAEVLHPGLFSVIQDQGRFGNMEFGVPLSGAMDFYAAKTANLILQNDPDSAVLEITMQGPKLKFQEPAEIVITGANLSPRINNSQIGNNKIIKLQAGDILVFGKRVSGCRAYVGVSGGFKTMKVLDSRSWYEGITEQSMLQKGMKLPYEVFNSRRTRSFSSLRFESCYMEQKQIVAFPGPEYEQLPKDLKVQLFNQEFTVSQKNNRMGIQLLEVFDNSLPSLISSPVIPGVVQLTPGGKLIVLMRDCQTTGGYPRVLQLSVDSINILAQKIPGDKIKFVLEE